jgi:hypothetical protein
VTGSFSRRTPLYGVSLMGHILSLNYRNDVLCTQSNILLAAAKSAVLFTHSHHWRYIDGDILPLVWWHPSRHKCYFNGRPINSQQHRPFALIKSCPQIGSLRWYTAGCREGGLHTAHWKYRISDLLTKFNTKLRLTPICWIWGSHRCDSEVWRRVVRKNITGISDLVF